MKELKDYLYLYKDCEIYIDAPSDGMAKQRTLLYIDESMENPVRVFKGEYVAAFQFDEIKPILCPVSSMTENIITWMFVLRATANNTTVDKKCRRTSIQGTIIQIEFEDYTSDYQDIKTLYPEQLKFLLLQYFDLFGLIEAGLAISKTK